MITAHIEPIIEDSYKEDPLYRILEIHMQRLGKLIPFREEMNWTSKIDTVKLGEETHLKGLQKLAAKNDGLLLFYAKLTKKTLYRNLILHPNTTGLYLPFRFDEPFTILSNGQKLWIGSALQLQDELKWLEMSIQNSSIEETADYWEHLRETCQTAINSMSPFYLKKEAE